MFILMEITMTRKNKILLYLLAFISLYSNSSNIENLVIPEGFEVRIFAEGLNSPRQITETDNGHIIVGSKKGDQIIAIVNDEINGFQRKKITLAKNLKNPTKTKNKNSKS
jgi:hypothetical protein